MAIHEELYLYDLYVNRCQSMHTAKFILYIFIAIYLIFYFFIAYE